MKPSELLALRKHIKHITWHWTAGPWWWTSKKYHFCVTYDWRTKKAKVKQTLSLWRVGEHVWNRNAGNVGISMCAMWRNPLSGFFHNVTEPHLEATAKLTAELMIALDVAPEDVHDHAFFASLDGYGPYSGHPETRVDVGPYREVLERKARWYYAKLVSGEMQPEYTLSLF